MFLDTIFLHFFLEVGRCSHHETGNYLAPEREEHKPIPATKNIFSDSDDFILVAFGKVW